MSYVICARENAKRDLYYEDAEVVGEIKEISRGEPLIDFLRIDLSLFKPLLSKANKKGSCLNSEDEWKIWGGEDEYSCSIYYNDKDISNLMKPYDKLLSDAYLQFIKIWGENLFLYTLIEIPNCPKMLVQNIKEMEKLQKSLAYAIKFCLDIETEQLNTLSPIQRYWIYEEQRYNDICNVNKLRSRELPLSISGDFHQEVLHIPIYEDIGDACPAYLDNKDIDNNLIETVKKIALTFVHGYTINTIQEAMFVEFLNLIKDGARLKKCGYCGNYFIQRGVKVADYCNRIPNGKHRTCQSIAASLNYRERESNNPILKEYNIAYKRMFARMKKGKIDRENFVAWKTMAKNNKENALGGNISFDEFKSFLGNK